MTVPNVIGYHSIDKTLGIIHISPNDSKFDLMMVLD